MNEKLLWCCCLPRLLVIVKQIDKQIECCLEQPPQSPMVFRWVDLFGKFQICIFKLQNEFWVSLWIHKINSYPSISLDFVRCTQPVKISRQLVSFSASSGISAASSTHKFNDIKWKLHKFRPLLPSSLVTLPITAKHFDWKVHLTISFLVKVNEAAWFLASLSQTCFHV